MILYIFGLFFVHAAAFFGDLSHFTWWNLLIFCVWCLLGKRRKNLELTSLLLNFTVVLVVVVMSFSKCEMINEAYQDYGGLIYGLGNFLVHYFHRLFWSGSESTNSKKSTCNAKESSPLDFYHFI